MSSSRTPFIPVGLSRLEWVTLLAVDPHASTVTVPYASTRAHMHAPTQSSPGAWHNSLAAVAAHPESPSPCIWCWLLTLLYRSADG